MMSTETSPKPGVALRDVRTLPKCVRICASALVLTLAAAGWASAADLQSAVLTIHYRNAEELSKVAAPLLSPAGRLSVDHRTNARIVVDTGAAIARVSDARQNESISIFLKVERLDGRP